MTGGRNPPPGMRLTLGTGAGRRRSRSVPVLTYVLAVLAAGANATSPALPRKANREVREKQNLSPRLTPSLLRKITS